MPEIGAAKSERMPKTSPARRRRSDLWRFCGGQSRTQGRTRLRQSVHPAGRGGAFRAGDRRRGEQGDAGAVQGWPTRRRRWSALGEAEIEDLIKTIGLFRNKAKNVFALSQQLIEQFGGEVPADREALETLPGVGRKTANVVLNIAFRQPTIAVDTHLFRVANRTGLAPGDTPLEVELGLLKVVPEHVPAPRPPLADPARPLRLQGAEARMLALHHPNGAGSSRRPRRRRAPKPALPGCGRSRRAGRCGRGRSGPAGSARRHRPSSSCMALAMAAASAGTTVRASPNRHLFIGKSASAGRVD